MNRKGTREQNDISIIIGNLPKRLQEKIISREGNNNSSRSHSGGSGCSSCTSGNVKSDSKEKKLEDESILNGAFAVKDTSAAIASLSGTSCRQEVSRNTTTNGKELTSIDYFLRTTLENNKDGGGDNVKPVSEASGSMTSTVTSTATQQEKKYDEICDAQTISAIPGLIRLNAGDAKKLSDNNVGTKNGWRNHDRRNRHLTRQEFLTTRYEQPMSPIRQVQKVQNPLWFETFNDSHTNELPTLFESLQETISHNQVIENWSNLLSIRQKLQDIFQHILINNLKLCCEQKVDSFFWKILFYNIREHLKQQNSKKAAKCIQIIIDEGIAFYDNLYQQLCRKYILKQNGTAATNLHNSLSAQQRSQYKTELMARVTAQKLLICLGDLWRYKIKDLQGQDYTEAGKFYQQAQSLIPSNGVPYNQLAIVAIHNRKKFDAIYFHMRSLMSSNSIHSAKESLLVLFDEIRKKYEETELKSSPLHQNYHNNNHQSSKSMRKEVWIYPDGVRRLHRTDLNGNNNNNKMIINEEKRFMEMTPDELLRRIISLYLYIIGKLYTGVGMETIQEHQRKLLLQISVLIRHERLAITKTRLLKMLSLNIFVIEHNLDKDTRRYHTFNFCNQMFGLLVRKTNELFCSLNANPEDFTDEDFLDLNTLLQYHRIYVLWLKHHVNIWEPIKSEEHIFLNSWLELEELFKLLKQENLYVIQNETIVFEEDYFLAGFTPLTSIIPKTKDDIFSDESLQFKARLKVILEFNDIYQQHQHRLENFETSHFINEDLNSDIKQALEDLQSSKGNEGDDENEEDANDDDNSENIVINGECSKSLKTNTLNMSINNKAKNDQLSHLSKLKKELEAKTHVKKMYNNKLEEILKFVDTKVYIEVRPKYLLPDTNCFIDCLEDFERIVHEFKRYTLIIPLTVVKELDGLSKGVKVDSYQESLQKQRIHHYDDVSSRAKKSLDFIKIAKNQVKCATTKGSIINSSLFALVEEEHVSNDDKILATAIALSKTMSSETSKDGKCFIQTELVLITTDRNLRVKSLSRNLAVSELPEFLQWAKDCN